MAGPPAAKTASGEPTSPEATGGRKREGTRQCRCPRPLKGSCRWRSHARRGPLSYLGRDTFSPQPLSPRIRAPATLTSAPDVRGEAPLPVTPVSAPRAPGSPGPSVSGLRGGRRRALATSHSLGSPSSGHSPLSALSRGVSSTMVALRGWNSHGLRALCGGHLRKESSVEATGTGRGNGPGLGCCGLEGSLLRGTCLARSVIWILRGRKRKIVKEISL